MGIDVEIKIGLKKKPSKEKVNFILNLYNDVACIEGDLVESDYEFYLSDYESLFEISSGTRYYGIGYERGPFLAIYSTCKLLLKLFEEFDPVLSYSGGTFSDDFSETTIEELESLFDFFSKNGEQNYRGTNYNDIKPLK